MSTLFDDETIEKRCVICGSMKPLQYFHRARRGKYGRESQCKPCRSKWSRDYYNRPEIKSARKAKYEKWYREMTEEERGAVLRRTAERNSAYRQRYPMMTLKKNLRRALERHPTDIPVTCEELIEMFDRQHGRCAVSGVLMTWGKGRFYPTSISIDRIDIEGGYSRDNVRLVCYQVNAFRGMWSDDQMLSMARAIVAHQELKVVRIA